LHYTYQTYTGLFCQDIGSSPGSSTVGPLEDGLSVKSPQFGPVSGTWDHLKIEIANLQAEASPGTMYKIFFLGRHGQGYHNIVMERYGEEAWWKKWYKESTDGELTWAPDPDLTPLGIQQANEANTLWKLELKAGAPVPEKLYCSPMTRALRTCFLTFQDILDDSKKVLVVESARETCGQTPCDKRYPLSSIRSAFPSFNVEPHFSEEDVLGAAAERETPEEMTKRVRGFLDRVFEHDAETYISITTHGGWIHYFLRIVGHCPFALGTGAILPVVVKTTLSQVE